MPDNDYDLDNPDDGLDPTDPDNTPKALREAAKRGREAQKKVTDLEREKGDLQRELAVYKAGLGSLKPLQVKALLGAHEGDLNPEGLKATAIGLGFAEPDEPAEDYSAEINAHEQISNASQGAGKTSAAAVLKPEEVATWPVDRLMRLNKDHPDIYERLMRGEEVAGFAFV